ncbi:hypothetical protein SDJN02_22719, partial [Cucurbita argyrosperma subsp. argyrosperma]
MSLLCSLTSNDRRNFDTRLLLEMSRHGSENGTQLLLEMKQASSKSIHYSLLSATDVSIIHTRLDSHLPEYSIQSGSFRNIVLGFSSLEYDIIINERIY